MMVWLAPSILFALASAGVPIVIHLFVQRRARRLPFPTLRFLRPSPLAAIRSRALDDPWLLIVRTAIVGCAVAAAAGPLVVWGARVRAWNARTTVAVAEQPAGASALPAIRKAVEWLDAQPTSRREILVRGPLRLGALTDADVASIPPDVGLRFERVPSSGDRVVTAAAPVLVGTSREVRVAARQMVVAEEGTRVSQSGAAAPGTFPIEVQSRLDSPADVAAAVDRVLASGIAVPADGRRARIEFAEDAAGVPAQPIGPAWMADAVAALSRAPLLAEAASERSSALGGAPPAATWTTVANAMDGPSIVAAADGNRLVVVVRARVLETFADLVIRSVAGALSVTPRYAEHEVVAIPDSVLHAWTRAPGPVDAKAAAAITNDRRWAWVAVLALIAIETLMRRSLQAAAVAKSTFRVEDRVA